MPSKPTCADLRREGTPAARRAALERGCKWARPPGVPRTVGLDGVRMRRGETYKVGDTGYTIEMIPTGYRIRRGGKTVAERSSRAGALKWIKKNRSRGLGVVTDLWGDKSTPKKAAQSFIMDAISLARGYWGEKHAHEYEKMTERERAQVDEQLEKQGDRVAKMFGYESSWRS